MPSLTLLQTLWWIIDQRKYKAFKWQSIWRTKCSNINDYPTWNINKVVKQMHQFRTHISYKHDKVSIRVLLTKYIGSWEAFCFLSWSHTAVTNDPWVNVTIDERSLVVTQVVFPFVPYGKWKFREIRDWDCQELAWNLLFN